MTLQVRRVLIVACAAAASAVTLLNGQQAQMSSPLQQLVQAARDGVYGPVDHLLVRRGGMDILNARFTQDYASRSRGRVAAIGCGDGCTDPSWDHHFNYFSPKWHPYFQGRDVHSLQSVTKSITALIVGIAMDRGAISDVNQPFLRYFADRDLSKVDTRLRSATLADVLTMRSGIEWHENDRPLDDTNTTVQLEKSRDWLAFTLAQPMDAAPGSRWSYNSGGSMLLSGVVRSATGAYIDDYAREHLFSPLGITEFHWKRTPTGHPDTEGGLYLTADGLARIGELMLNRGRWDGRQVVSAAWVDQLVHRHVPNVSAGWDYGYQWWLTRRAGVDVWAGRGFGGQFLLVIPERRLVGVSLAWNVFGDRVPGILTPLLDAMLTVPPQ